MLSNNVRNCDANALTIICDGSMIPLSLVSGVAAFIFSTRLEFVFVYLKRCDMEN